MLQKMIELGMPTQCPTCGSKVEWHGVDLKCTNFECSAIQSKRVACFISNCGIENVTEVSLNNWGITNFKRLSNFTPDSKYSSQVKFYNELKEKIYSKSKEEIFANMIFDGAANKTINKIIDFYGKGDMIEATKVLYTNGTTLVNYPEKIGQKTIDNIQEDWMRNIKILKHIISDARYNYVPTVKQNPASTKLEGKTFCITGTLSQGRKEFEKMITDNGGVISSVSKKLDYLIAGNDAGSKLDKAKGFGINIISEDVFKGMIG